MAAIPRVVVVTRKSDYQLLLERHGTHEQARFFLSSRDQDVDQVLARHQRFEGELSVVLQAVPRAWRRARIERGDLHRFLFEPEDIVVAVGQDGLVANVAKYLDGQHVVGINPDPERYDGVLVPSQSSQAERLLLSIPRGEVTVELRTMVEARLDDGQRLLALNEIFVGHQSHQSARYLIELAERSERHSSSGLIVTTGTGATGWARSVHRERRTEVVLPSPEEARLAFFVREAFPSRATGTDLTDGALGPDASLVVVSRMNDGGVLFGDGIEDDRLLFHWGSRATLRIAPQTLKLVRNG